MTHRLFATALLLVLSGAACGGSETAKPAATPSGPSIEVADPPANVAGNVVTLPVTVRGIGVVKADGDTSGKTGHFHVFIDREPVAVGASIPKDKGIVHSADNPIKLYGLTTGPHTATVVMGDGAHTRILGDVAEQMTFTVDGPSVQASAPATIKAGDPLTLTVAVQGVQIVAANGDTSGRTAHMHLFVDRTPTPAGQAIPKEAGIIHTTETTVNVPGLAAGEHTVWVVLGDGVHTPLAPEVVAKVTTVVA